MTTFALLVLVLNPPSHFLPGEAPTAARIGGVRLLQLTPGALKDELQIPILQDREADASNPAPPQLPISLLNAHLNS